jgi:hypothetical protein
MALTQGTALSVKALLVYTMSVFFCLEIFGRTVAPPELIFGTKAI